MPTAGQEVALFVMVLDGNDPPKWAPWAKAFDVVKKDVTAESPRYSDNEREDVLLRLHLELDEPERLKVLRAEDMIHHVGVVIDGISVASDKQHADEIKSHLSRLCTRLRTRSDAYFRHTGFYLFVAGLKEGDPHFDQSQIAFRDDLKSRVSGDLGIDPRHVDLKEVLGELDLVCAIRYATTKAMTNYSFRTR